MFESPATYEQLTSKVNVENKSTQRFYPSEP